MADVEKIAAELREAARPINGWAKPGRADLMLRAADELDRLREVEKHLREQLTYADEHAAKVEALLEPHIKWDNPPAHEPGTIRICPMRDGPCWHGMHCPYVGDGYMGYPCKEGWDGPRALSAQVEERE